MCQKLEVRINPYVPVNIRNGKVDNLYRCVNKTGSAPAERLLNMYPVL